MSTTLLSQCHTERNALALPWDLLARWLCSRMDVDSGVYHFHKINDLLKSSSSLHSTEPAEWFSLSLKLFSDWKLTFLFSLKLNFKVKLLLLLIRRKWTRFALVTYGELYCLVVRDVQWAGPLGFHRATDSAPFLRVRGIWRRSLPSTDASQRARSTTFIQAACCAVHFGTKLYFQREYFKNFLQVLTCYRCTAMKDTQICADKIPVRVIVESLHPDLETTTCHIPEHSLHHSRVATHYVS